MYRLTNDFAFHVSRWHIHTRVYFINIKKPAFGYYMYDNVKTLNINFQAQDATDSFKQVDVSSF